MEHEIDYAPGRTGTDQVLFAHDGNLGRILLNRPKAINSLNAEMCRAILEQLRLWADDPAIKTVTVEGAGERGLCAGGDVKSLRQAVVADPKSPAPAEFWETEYEMNQLIADYPKPYLAVMDGVCMGGGLGISAHGSIRLVTPRSKLAMPETIIGFFPDVGMLHLLSRMPGEFGTFLALTGRTIGAGDALAAGLADHLIAEADIQPHLAATAAGGVVAAAPAAPEPELFGAGWIAECFVGDDAQAIVQRLGDHDDEGARRAAEDITARSPFAVSVTLAALRRAAELSLSEVFAQDLRLSRHFATDPDFLEGVRCQLVDRGDTPQWRHRSLADVDPAEVAALF
ncbi:enoyl-CoA hydratase/isomerase family protein [Naumannella sp. ID2617S]|nr:enoyl-CoA hydratase/isomerase family protein [Naumannella sp. ID2617S]